MKFNYRKFDNISLNHDEIIGKISKFHYDFYNGTLLDLSIDKFKLRSYVSNLDVLFEKYIDNRCKEYDSILIFEDTKMHTDDYFGKSLYFFHFILNGSGTINFHNSKNSETKITSKFDFNAGDLFVMNQNIRHSVSVCSRCVSYTLVGEIRNKF